MKTVIFSFAAVALMMISSVATAQCSSCGQQAAQPITFAQPIATEAITYAQPATVDYVQPATFAAQPAFTSYAAPVQASFVAQPTTSSSCCGTVSYNAPVATNPCCCGTTTRGGLLRGNRSGLLGNTIPARATRAGLFSAIRN